MLLDAGSIPAASTKIQSHPVFRVAFYFDDPHGTNLRGAGALQMMLDRGESLDWFASREVTIEVMLAGLVMYLFVAHIFTHKHPFIVPGLLRIATSAPAAPARQES